MYKCKNIGCYQNFVIQCSWKDRDRECSKPQPSPSYIEVKDGFKSCRCRKVFLHQSNASRHAKKGSLVKTKSINRCGTCSKTFNFKSELKRHLESKKKTCSCGRLSKEWIILKNTCWFAQIIVTLFLHLLLQCIQP